MVFIKNTDNFYFGASQEIISRARLLRKNMTMAERVLWYNLQNHQFKELKFRRQHPICQFIVDFYCHKLKLVIELDGNFHHDDAQKVKDDYRTQELNRFGLTVIRFDNEIVLMNISKVKSEIEKFLKIFEN